MRLISTFLAIALGLAGCANPSIVSVKSTAIEKISISKIYIPRFEGNPDFVEESTDYFISKLEPKISATIIQGSALRTESTDIASGGNLAPSELAISKAKEAGAQILIMGKVTSHKTSTMLNGFSTIRVIDVSTGNVVANFHRPSGILIGYSEHQAVMAAVARTANDVATAINPTKQNPDAI